MGTKRMARARTWRWPFELVSGKPPALCAPFRCGAPFLAGCATFGSVQACVSFSPDGRPNCAAITGSFCTQYSLR